MTDDNSFKVQRDPRLESRIELLKEIVFPSQIKRGVIVNGVQTSVDSPYFLLNTREYGLSDLDDFEIGTIWLGYTIVSDSLNNNMDDFAEKFSGEIINFLMLKRSKGGMQLKHLLKEHTESKQIFMEDKPFKSNWGFGNKPQQ
jgi:hypothetical protein